VHLLWKSLSTFNRHCLRGQQDFFVKYAVKGGDSYAVVTGGSDGIGLEICHQLAQQGFNICMVSRNEEKMQEKLAEIKEKASKVKTMYVVADFVSLNTIDQY